MTAEELELHIKKHPDLFIKLACEKSFYVFIKQAWRHIDTNPYVDGEHIKLIANTLQECAENIGGNVTINIPPRCSKSRITCVLYPAWIWINYPHLKLLTASYSSDLATRDAIDTRTLINTAWYQKNWGDRFVFRDDQNRQNNYANDKGGYRKVVSPGALTTGEGGDIIIADDLCNAEQAYSDTDRRKINRWYSGSFYNRTINPDKCSRILIGQRLHEDDIFAHVKTKENSVHICLPATYDPSLSTHSWPGYSEEGDLLSPNRLSQAVLDDYLKELTPRPYSAQYQQRPTPISGNIIKSANLKYWHVLPEFPDEYIQSWDLIFGNNLNKSDYVVGQVWARKGTFYYLIDQVRGRWSFPDTLREIRNLTARYPKTEIILIEQAANGSAAIQTLRSEINGVLPVVASKNKLDRLRAVHNLIECEQVFLPAGAEFVDDLVFELTTFTGTSADKNDDQVDALTQALKRLKGDGNSDFSIQSYL